MLKGRNRILCLVMVISLMLIFLAGCNPATTTKVTTAATTKATTTATTAANTTAPLPLLEYSMCIGTTLHVPEVDNPNDVVTPYIEKLFNIKVKEVVMTDSSNPAQQTINLRIAAGDPIDVCQLSPDNASYAVSTGKYADLTPYIDKMVNMNKYFDQKFWPRFILDGKKCEIPCVLINAEDPKYKDDPFALNFGLTFWTREDLLTKCGYTFEPLASINARTCDIGKKPTLADYQITPAIDTPDKFTNYLRQIKALNIKVGDKPLVPLESYFWSSFHMGCMFDFGRWRVGDDGQACGYLGMPGAYKWEKMLATWYREGLIDPEHMSQKDDVLMNKIASGLAGAGMAMPNAAKAIAGMASVDPTYIFRKIPLPKDRPGYGCCDIFEGGYWRFIISSEFSAEELDRLCQYFDWFYSDEGLDIVTWGPESAGLWELKDGKKQFKDPELLDSLMNGTDEGQKGTEYYGLYTPARNSQQNSFFSRAALCAPMMEQWNPFDQRRNYPIKLNSYTVMESICGAGNYDTSGKYSTGDGGLNCAAVSNYFWAKFQSDRMGKLWQTKTDAEFDAEWKAQYDLFVTEGQYNEAVADMNKWFEAAGMK
jgi:putative aldouronate transport system substrate-binding protein